MSRADTHPNIVATRDHKQRPGAPVRPGGQAFVVKVGGQYFGGFGGRPPGPYIVKLRARLADALLCDHPNKAADYVTRLAKRGHAGATVHPIKEA